MLVTEMDLPQFDLNDPELKGEAWHQGMADLVDSGAWLAESPLATVVLGREAGEFFLRTKSAIFPGLLIAEIFGITDGQLREQIDHNIINVNGADHSRLRSLVNPSLTPKAANSWRPVMREFLEDLWADLNGATEFDFIDAFARPYPSLTISRVMGAPREDAGQLHEWSEWIQRQFDPIALSNPETLAGIETRVGEFYSWVRPMIEARRGSPGEDLISSLIVAEEEGERLSDVELENLVLNILVGGVDTTQNQLAHTMRLLSNEPEQWAALRAAPETLVPRAVQESVRFEPITPITARQLTDDVEFNGVTFPAGTVVAVCAFTGNRDPDVFEHPRDFDIVSERPKARVLTFGAGTHYCVGANLAKAELETGLAFFAEKFKTLEPAGEPDLQTVSGIYGIDSLPLRVTT